MKINKICPVLVIDKTQYFCTMIDDHGGENHMYEVRESDVQKLAALRTALETAERERDELRGLVLEISDWITNWEPDFTEDDEWEQVAKRIDAAALAKGDGKAGE